MSRNRVQFQDSIEEVQQPPEYFAGLHCANAESQQKVVQQLPVAPPAVIVGEDSDDSLRHGLTCSMR